MLYKNSKSNDYAPILTLSSSKVFSFRLGFTPLQIAKHQQKNALYIQSNWIEVNLHIGRVFFVKLAKIDGSTVFTTTTSINIKISAFQDYGCLSWVMWWGELIMKMWITQVNCTRDEAMHSLFQVIYYILKELIPFSKFPGLCSFFVNIKLT